MPWCSKVGMKVRIVDSFPPPVPVLVKTLPTFPIRAPFSHKSPVRSRKFRICPAMFPNLVGVPKMMASYCGSSPGVANGASCSSFAPVLLGHFGRHRIGNALYHHIGIRRASAFGNGLGHDFDVAIH